MACWVRGFRTCVVALVASLPLACDDGAGGTETAASDDTHGADDGGSTGGQTSGPVPSTSGGTTSSGPTTDPSGATTTDPSGTTDPTDPTGSEGGSGDEGPIPADGWIEIGYGLDSFFPFEGELPLTLGPQGFMMFSLPLRGGGFPVAPDPFDFDHPDTPILSVWTDIDGIEATHPSGHFAAYLDYPVPFTASDEEGVEYEFVSVWLVIPETIPPEELAGREAVVHAELACSDGQVLIDEHVLTVIDDTAGKGGA